MTHTVSVSDGAVFVTRGLFNILENPLYAANTTLKGSQRVLGCVSEALVLLWKLASGNPVSPWSLPLELP